jgi:hypothetical protein
MLIEDKANELRNVEDLWPDIKEHIASAAVDAMMSLRSFSGSVEHADVLADLERKYRKGDEEYNREWLNMSLADLEQEVYQELLDLVVYHALIRARFKLVQQ